jgi:tetratricopeptide (TPR) repeat protein
MEKRMDFRFEVPRQPVGDVIELSNSDAERILLEKLKGPDSNRASALWDLAQFYKLTKQHEKALERLRELIRLLPNPEDKANCVFTIGQAMEQVGDYQAACRYYKEAETLEPANTFTSYFINNNLGFCLNTLGRFTEGETYCRRALAIDPKRSNAHKNLGIAFSGQGQYHEAARCFITATQVNAADPRAFHLLDQLLKEHPEMTFEFQDDMDCCRKAIEVATKRTNELQPVVQRGWRRQWVLLQIRARTFLLRFRGRIGKK